MMTQKLKHGEIWLANLNLNKGTEPGKVRPVLIIQNQALLDSQHPTTLIIPLTSNITNNNEPLRLRIKAKSKLKNDSDLLIDQIRAIDNKRLISGPLAKCNTTLMEKVYQATMDVMGAWLN